MGDTFGTRDVARLTGIGAQRLRQLVRDGWVHVDRDARGGLSFDLSAMGRIKRAHQLVSQVSHGRLRAALAALDGPPDIDRLDVEGGELVVRDGGRAWEARTGQLTFHLEPDPRTDEVAELPATPELSLTQTWSGEDWFHLGCDLDGYDDDRAKDAYRRAIGEDDGLVDAKVNLGRLLAAEGDTSSALRLLREAIDDEPGHAFAWFDLGTVYEAIGKDNAALHAYGESLEADPYLADAHLNASRICERLGQDAEAIQHLAAYRQLTAS